MTFTHKIGDRYTYALRLMPSGCVSVNKGFLTFVYTIRVPWSITLISSIIIPSNQRALRFYTLCIFCCEIIIIGVCKGNTWNRCVLLDLFILVLLLFIFLFFEYCTCNLLIFRQIDKNVVIESGETEWEKGFVIMLKIPYRQEERDEKDW